MPKKVMDYSNTHLYKIVCKDLNIKDCYVGSTLNFVKRRCQHKFSCLHPTDKHHNTPVYEFIRNNGSWENWEMILINTECVANSIEATQRERHYKELLNATLNTQIQSRTRQEWVDTNKTVISQKQKEYRELHSDTIKNKKKQHYEQNKENILKKCKKYRGEHKDESKQYQSSYREMNQEIVKVSRKEWYDRNKDKLSEKMICECGSSFLKRAIARHYKTIEHQEYIKSMTSLEETPEQ